MNYNFKKVHIRIDVCAKKKTKHQGTYMIYLGVVLNYTLRIMICCNLRGKIVWKVLVEQWLCLFFLWCEYVLFFFFIILIQLHFSLLTVNANIHQRTIFFFLKLFLIFHPWAFFLNIFFHSDDAVHGNLTKEEEKKKNPI